MIYYVAYKSRDGWDIYKVTENGQCYTMFKRVKTEKAVDNFAKTHWVKKRA